MTLAFGAFMLIAAAGWACLPSQKHGDMWFSGSTGVNVASDDPGTVVAESDVGNGSKEIGSCPGSPPHQFKDAVTEFASGDVVCVQAKNLDHIKRLYELKYVRQTGARDHTLCMNSRTTLPNLSSDHGLYEPWRGANGATYAWYGWEDQQTVLDMPSGSYMVCAVTATPPGSGANWPTTLDGTGKMDNSNMFITLTEPDPFVTTDPDTSPEFWPDHGDLFYDGAHVARSSMTWEDPVGWHDDDPGYEHDLVLNGPEYADGCTTSTDLPAGYDDCWTANILAEPGQEYWAFSFGSYNADLIHPGKKYDGSWELEMPRDTPLIGSWAHDQYGADESNMWLNAQDMRNRCPFNFPNIWCMVGIESEGLLEGTFRWGEQFFDSWSL